jgi:DNA repair protein RadD
MTVLRPYQTEAVGGFYSVRVVGKRRIIMTAPTGSGKTVIAGEIIRWTVGSGGRVLVIAHRREIVGQTSRKLDDIEIEHGIILAGEPTEEAARVQVASVQTLYVRGIRGTKMELPPADLIIVDECHHATAMTWRKIIESYRMRCCWASRQHHAEVMGAALAASSKR